MELQVRRAFKKAGRPCKCAEMPESPVLKWAPSFFVTPAFSKNLSTPTQVKISKMENKYSANYIQLPPLCFCDNLKGTCSHISIHSLGLYPSLECLLNFLSISASLREIFKLHLPVKK